MENIRRNNRQVALVVITYLHWGMVGIHQKALGSLGSLGQIVSYECISTGRIGRKH
jgi:hypothetical protein